jgi:hypothetical protein
LLGCEVQIERFDVRIQHLWSPGALGGEWGISQDPDILGAVHVFLFESLVMSLAFYALMAVKVWAFIDAVTRSSEAYVAAGKLTKPGWLLILGLTVGTSLLWSSPLGLFSIIGTVAAFVYLLDVKPALASVTRRR